MKMEKLKALLSEFGGVAIAIYLVIFVLVLVGFALAIRMGVKVESAAGGAGVLGAAYLATKLAQPLRIAATLALTPLVARVLRRVRRGRGAEPPEGTPS